MDKKCVIICGGAQSPALEQIPSIIEQYDQTVIIGADRGALRLVQAGYTLDYAVGDFDSVSKLELKHIKENAYHFTQYPMEKDDTDMGIGMKLAIKTAPEADYYLLGALGEKGGRLDHFISNLWMVHLPQYRPYIERIYFVESHSRTSFYMAGEHFLKNNGAQYLSIIALTPVKQLTICNAKYELPTTDISHPCAFISNEFIEGDARISFSSGIMMVMTVTEFHAA